MTSSDLCSVDVLDQAAPLTPAHSTHALRHPRAKVVAAPQASYAGMFAPAIDGISVVERLLVALHTCRISRSARLADHYRSRLIAESAKRKHIAEIDTQQLAMLGEPVFPNAENASA